MSSQRLNATVRQFAQEIDAANRDIYQLTRTIRELEHLLLEIHNAGTQPDARLSSELKRTYQEVYELQGRLRQLMQELGDTNIKIRQVMS